MNSFSTADEARQIRYVSPAELDKILAVGTMRPDAGKQPAEQSEVWREIELNSNRVEHLGQAVDALWERLGSAGVLAPTPPAQPAEIDTNGLDSPLAGVLRKQGHFVSQHELRLRNLIAALRV